MSKVNKEIVLTNRKDFIIAMREVFIPSCNRLKISFNYGHGMNNWTSFGCWVDDNTFVSYELVESK